MPIVIQTKNLQRVKRIEHSYKLIMSYIIRIFYSLINKLWSIQVDPYGRVTCIS